MIRFHCVSLDCFFVCLYVKDTPPSNFRTVFFTRKFGSSAELVRVFGHQRAAGATSGQQGAVSVAPLILLGEVSRRVRGWHPTRQWRGAGVGWAWEGSDEYAYRRR
jgi:hypothetical protein